MPAVVLMLNYVANKVRVEQKQLIPSLFMISIGKKGRVIKSSSVESAIEYFQHIGMVDHGSTAMENANGKALVWEIGSPEGLGLEMNRLKCRNAILFFDELRTLTSKGSIDGSTLVSRLLTLYESGKFQNIISKRGSFSFDPKSYCLSLIACCTEDSFNDEWSKLVGRSSGLNSRTFFLYEPEHLMDMTPQIYVPTQEGALKTRRLVDKAIQQGFFKIDEPRPLQEAMKRLGNRCEIRAEKFALFFAIDMGKDEIDSDCVERGIALAEYEKEVKRFLALGEAETKEGSVQQKIVRALKKHKGVMEMRVLKNKTNAARIGTTLWNQAYIGLVKDEQVKTEGAGTIADPKRARLLRIDQEDEDVDD